MFQVPRKEAGALGSKRVGSTATISKAGSAGGEAACEKRTVGPSGRRWLWPGDECVARSRKQRAADQMQTVVGVN